MQADVTSKMNPNCVPVIWGTPCIQQRLSTREVHVAACFDIRETSPCPLSLPLPACYQYVTIFSVDHRRTDTAASGTHNASKTGNGFWECFEHQLMQRAERARVRKSNNVQPTSLLQWTYTVLYQWILHFTHHVWYWYTLAKSLVNRDKKSKDVFLLKNINKNKKPTHKQHCFHFKHS